MLPNSSLPYELMEDNYIQTTTSSHGLWSQTEYKEENKLSTSTHLSQFQTVGTRWPTTSNICCWGLPAMLHCTFELWARTNPFSCKLHLSELREMQLTQWVSSYSSCFFLTSESFAISFASFSSVFMLQGVGYGQPLFMETQTKGYFHSFSWFQCEFFD